MMTIRCGVDRIFGHVFHDRLLVHEQLISAWNNNSGSATVKSLQQSRSVCCRTVASAIIGRSAKRTTDITREVITSRGFGPEFLHRTGHSIDSRDLHGSGPHIDNLETREARLLIPGIGFSIEPGVYLDGDFGMRSEVNAYVSDSGVVITPREYQKDLIIV